MQTKAPEPVGLELSKGKKTLTVRWNDDHTSVLPLTYLRGYCPCAQCQGHGGGWFYVPNNGPDLAEINEVGHYAIGLVWSDGHRTGIYAFETLRNLCPCDACMAAQGERHPARRIDVPRPT